MMNSPKRTPQSVPLAIATWCAACAFTTLVSADGGGNPCLPHHAVPDQVVLELNQSGSIENIMAIVEPLFPGVSVAFAFPEEDLYLLNAPDPICEQTLVQTLMALPGVDEAELNEEGESVEGQTQSFFFASSQTDFEFQYTWPTIRLVDAQSESLGEGIKIAVIDSGIDINHPIFGATQFLPGVDFVNDGAGMYGFGNGIDEDGDGVIDELSGHGTYVAGLIATIAPKAEILPLRAMDTEGRGSGFSVAAALIEAYSQGVDIVNLSFGSSEDIGVIEPIVEAMTDDGILIVVSAGNAGINDNGNFPAKMGPILAVAATDQFDMKAPFSNSGPYISVCAPGVGIVSAAPGGGYVTADGTSAAAAIVTGTTALVMSKDDCDGDTAHLTVEETATPIDDKNPKAGDTLGSGRLDAGAAVDAVPIPGDYDHDRKIDADDLSVLIGSWGTPAGDLNGDGTTDSIDLAVLIGNWSW
jgi:thermitase